MKLIHLFNILSSLLFICQGYHISSLTQKSAQPIYYRSSLPRLVLYQQTHHLKNGTSVSILPLIYNPAATHVIIGAWHVNGPDWIHLNDHSPEHDRFWKLRWEIGVLQNHGIKVMGMLGGAARGSFARLSRWRENPESV
jgi:hypothetical protein